ncbi:MAG: hypothetical protein JNJ60_22990 [Rhodocyclaceae bacterium]|nr:hypothetical protein [Rhodocyclaceae bacterium]
MADAAKRLAALLDLLPRVYTAQPRGSRVGSLLQAMAASLAEVDADLTRVLHDRWVGLANATPGADSGASALERLGAAMQIQRLAPRLTHDRWQRETDGSITVKFVSARQLADGVARLLGSRDALAALEAAFPDLDFTLSADGQNLGVRRALAWEPGEPDALEQFLPALLPEDAQAYRARIQITATILRQGLTSPRALLSLAMACLGTEPCSELVRRADTWIARGVPLGTRRRCAVCQGKSRGPCPNAAAAPVDAELTENPPQEAGAQQRRLPPRRLFMVTNWSLCADRPRVTLYGADRALAYPALQSRSTGEILLYAGTLKPGEALELYPQVEAHLVAAFDGWDAPAHHGWLAQHPRGRALLRGADGHAREVGDFVFHLRGDRFDDALSTFGGPGRPEGMRLGQLEQVVRTPLVQPGDNEWMLLTFAKPDAVFDDDTSRFAAHDALDGTRYALVDASGGGGFLETLLKSISGSNTGGENQESTEALVQLDLDLHWVARPPASFRMRIPKNGWVRRAELRGGLDLVRQELDRARAAGVHAALDFPQPLQRENHAVAERYAMQLQLVTREDAAPAAGELQFAARAAYRETHDSEDGRLTFSARFDSTRFDGARVQ